MRLIFLHSLHVYAAWYVQDLTSKKCDGAATPVIVKQSAGTALVDGRNGIGPVS